jgi:hypothetical protein
MKNGFIGFGASAADGSIFGENEMKYLSEDEMKYGFKNSQRR